MITLNIANVESLILHNKNKYQLFPDLKHFFKQWEHNVLYGLRTRQVLLDLLQSFNETHILALQNYLRTEIKVESVDYNIVKYLKIPISDTEHDFCEINGYKNFTTYRDADYLYICCWR
jgi:hypothetical protein